MFRRIRDAWIAWRWLPERIGQLTAILLVFKASTETSMDEIKELLRTAKGLIDNVVGDIRDLKDRLKDGGLTAEEVAEIKAELTAHIESLANVAAMHEPPAPPPAPEPAPEPTDLPPVEPPAGDITEQPE